MSGHRSDGGAELRVRVLDRYWGKFTLPPEPGAAPRRWRRASSPRTRAARVAATLPAFARGAAAP